MLDLVLQAIAEPRRREILLLLRSTERSSGEIAAHFEVTRPAISQHLQVLAAAGLVMVRRKGTQRLYRARPEGFEDLMSFLEGFWDEHLQILKQEAADYAGSGMLSGWCKKGAHGEDEVEGAEQQPFEPGGFPVQADERIESSHQGK